MKNDNSYKGINWLYEINDPSDKSKGHYIQEYPEDIPEEEMEGYDEYLKQWKRRRVRWNIIAIVMTPVLLIFIGVIAYTMWEFILGLYEVLKWWF